MAEEKTRDPGVALSELAAEEFHIQQRLDEDSALGPEERVRLSERLTNVRGVMAETHKAALRDKPIMIGARVHPKLQYGLRLLSRVQGGTIAEALEWAINLAMRRTGIGAGISSTTLDELVDAAWQEASEPRRIYIVFDRAPELLDFEERGAWGLVRRCGDLWRTTYMRAITETFEDEDGAHESMIGMEECEADDPERLDLQEQRAPRFELIEPNWNAIKAAGIALARAGEIDKTYTLKQIVSGSALKNARLA